MRRPWLGAAALGLLAIAAHVPTLSARFVYDDRSQLLSNPATHSWRHVGLAFTVCSLHHIGRPGDYRPITTASWALDALTWGRIGAPPPAWPFHLTNMLLHAVVTMLLPPLLGRFTSRETATVAAALFAVHPVHVEAVAWIVGRAEILSLLFVLATVLAMRLERATTRALAVAAASLLAYGSKENAFLLPAYLALATAWDGPTRRRPGIDAVATSVAALVACFAVRGWVFRADAPRPYLFEGSSPLLRAQVASALIATYARLLVWPWPLKIEYAWPAALPPPVDTTAGLLIVAALLALGLWPRARAAAAWAGVALLALSPVLHIQPLAWLVGERFLYTPSVGFCAMVALCLVRLRFWSRLVANTLFAGLIVASLSLSLRQSTVWHDDLTLFEHAEAYTPSSTRVQNNLASACLEAGQVARALRHFAIVHKLDPTDRQARYNLARAQLLSGQAAEALRLLGPRADWTGDREALELWDRAAAASRRGAPVGPPMRDGRPL